MLKFEMQIQRIIEITNEKQPVSHFLYLLPFKKKC